MEPYATTSLKKEKEDQTTDTEDKLLEPTASKNTALDANANNRLKTIIPMEITPTIANTATRHHALHYSDRDLWGHRTNEELDKLYNNGTIRWLRPAELGIIPEKTKLIPLTFTLNYKRDKDGSIEERKSRDPFIGD